MTNRQERALQTVRAKIRDIRGLLDGVMYYSDPLTDDEFKKVREAYDLVCKANDKL